MGRSGSRGTEALTKGMEERESFMNADVTLRRSRLYAFRFALIVFAWTALKLGILDLIAEYSTRTFVFPVFAEGILVATFISTAIYGVETKSRKAKISIFVLLGALALLAVADRIRDF
ncbi:MAG: hypothetical protein ACM3JB_15920 [Acidobacteriaceae bacterium]